MKAIVKWPGGKERELKYLLKYIPDEVNNFYEPFVGGGSVFAYFLTNNLAQNYFINDFSTDLMSLYDNAINNFEEFNHLCNQFDHLRHNLDAHSRRKQKFCATVPDDLIVPEWFSLDIFLGQLDKTIMLKSKQFNGFENNRSNFMIAISTAYHSAIYYTMRTLYNTTNNEYKYFYFYIMRELCYSSMFRFNSKGEFNVPYGGHAYNLKQIQTKVALLNILENNNAVNTSNLDFEEFLNAHQITSEDFIFLDPPYDSEFSDYDNNTFDKNDQIRLRNFLLSTPAQFVVIIKSTPFIENIYNDNRFVIERFDKKYNVNFKNRNNQDVVHLLIRRKTNE